MNTKGAIKLSDMAWNVKKCASMKLDHFTKVCEGYVANGKAKKPLKDEVEKLHKKLQEAQAEIDADAKKDKK